MHYTEQVEVSCEPADFKEGVCVDNHMNIPSCMTELEIQLVTVFVVKQFAFQLVEVGLPYIKAKARDRQQALRRAEDTKRRKEYIEMGMGDVMQPACVNDTQEELTMDAYTSVFADYNELAIQFGYSTLFAVAFPLAPLFAWINNVLEIRSDAYKLCKVYRRPAYTTRQDIGTWETVFEMIAVGAVITNALLIGFVGSQMSMWLDTTGYESFHQEARTVDYRLWFIAVLVEHTILILRFTIKTVMPTRPNWIANAKAQMERDAKNLLGKEEREQLMEQRRREDAESAENTGARNFERRMRKTALRSGKELPSRLRSELVDLFYCIDGDRGGCIGPSEADQCIPTSMIESTLLKWDQDEDGNISLHEWLASWSKLHKFEGPATPGDRDILYLCVCVCV